SEVTSLCVGEGVVSLAEPENDTALAVLLKRCRNQDTRVLVLGAGTNLIGDDADFDGVAIRLSSAKFAEVSYGRTRHATVGAGLSLGSLLRRSAESGLGGFAPLAAIPGTLGGALRMNAGAEGVEVSDLVVELFGLRLDGSFWSAGKGELEWGYRSSGVPDDVVLTGAICEFREVDPEREARAMSKSAALRRGTQPKGRSAGCVFQNPAPDLSAGWLIERAGLKNASHRHLRISNKHANFILNDEKSASEKDLISLVRNVKQSVFENSGVILEPEVRFIGSDAEESLKKCVSAPKVLVLKGGDSNERDVSLHSAEGVENSLRIAGCEVAGIDVPNLEFVDELFSDSDPNLPFPKGEYVVFPVLHGGFGEDGRLQALLERLGIPCVGCSSKACALAMDKAKSKKIMEECGIPTPKFAILERGETEFPGKLTFPVVVKPPEEGSTVGISVARNPREWTLALEKAFKYSRHALAEEFVKGVEITVGIVGGKALPVIEIRFPGEMFDFDAKYEHKLGETLYRCPPETVPVRIQDEARRISLDFAAAIDSLPLTRVDLIIDENNRPMVLEANNLPGFTASSLLPKAAAKAGLPFPLLCAKLARLVK
ncbi:MAG: D-alanine--D-alanine ligase, partial [Victivallales bacterium]|nr:D-alanine--D-alanine ligase [Victivallales bacterium]